MDNVTLLEAGSDFNLFIINQEYSKGRSVEYFKTTVGSKRLEWKLVVCTTDDCCCNQSVSIGLITTGEKKRVSFSVVRPIWKPVEGVVGCGRPTLIWQSNQCLPQKGRMVCTLKVFNYLVPEWSTVGYSKLFKNFGELFESAEDADLSIVLGPEEIRVHKIILSARSPVFKKMFSNDLAEKRTGLVKIENCDYDAMKATLKFIYSGVCPDIDKYADKILDLAERYQLEDLKDLAADTLRKLLSPETAVRTLLLAEKYEIPDLRKACFTYIFLNKTEVRATKDWKHNTSHHLIQICESAM